MNKKRQLYRSLLSILIFFGLAVLVWAIKSGKISGRADLVRPGESRTHISYLTGTPQIQDAVNLTQLNGKGLLPFNAGQLVLQAGGDITRSQTPTSGTPPRDLKNWSKIKVTDQVVQPVTDSSVTATVGVNAPNPPYVRLITSQPVVNPLPTSGRLETAGLEENISNLSLQNIMNLEADITVTSGQAVIGLVSGSHTVYSTPASIGSSIQNLSLTWNYTSPPEKIVVGTVGGGSASIDIYNLKLTSPTRASAKTVTIGGANIKQFTRILTQELAGINLPNNSLEVPISGTEGVGNWEIGSRGVEDIPAPVIVTFNATSTGGGSSTIQWAVTNAASCSINQGIGTLDDCSSGSRTVSPTASTAYELTVNGYNGAEQQIQSFTVGAQPTILDFTSTKTVYNQGEDVTLSWHSTNCVDAILKRNDTALPGNAGCNADAYKDLTAPTGVNLSYVLTINGSAGTTPAIRPISQAIRVDIPASITSFTATPNTITTPGSPVTLSWAISTNTVTCIINPGNSPCLTSHTLIVNPTSDTDYTLTAQGPSDTTASSLTAHIGVGSPAMPPNIDFFNINPTSGTVGDGEDFILSWQASNAQSCILKLGTETISSACSDSGKTLYIRLAEGTSQPVTYHYTLTIHSDWATTDPTKTIDVTVNPDLPPGPGGLTYLNSQNSKIVGGKPTANSIISLQRAQAIASEISFHDPVSFATNQLSFEQSPTSVTNGTYSLKVNGVNTDRKWLTTDQNKPVDYLYQMISFSPNFNYQLKADIKVESGQAVLGVGRHDDITIGKSSSVINSGATFQTITLPISINDISTKKPDLIYIATTNGPGYFIVDNVRLTTEDALTPGQNDAYIAYKIKTNSVDSNWGAITSSAELRPSSTGEITLNDTIAPIDNKYMQVEMMFYGNDTQIIPALSGLDIDYKETVADQVVSTVDITPATLNTTVGGTQVFTAVAKDSTGTPVSSGLTLTWSLADETIASLSSSSGSSTTLTAVKLGSVDLKVVASAGGASAEKKVNVTVANPPPAVVASLVATPTTFSAQVGTQLQFSAQAKDAADANIASGVDYVWSVTPANIISISSVSVREPIISATGVGSATLTVQAKQGGVVKKAVDIPVTITTSSSDIPKSISVEPTKLETEINTSGGGSEFYATQEFNATVKNISDGNITDSATITWSSGNTHIAVADPPTGDSTVVKVLGAGSTSILARATSNGRIVSYSVPVTIKGNNNTSSGSSGGGGSINTVGSNGSSSGGGSKTGGSLLSTGGSLAINLLIAAILSAVTTWVIYRKKGNPDVPLAS